MDITAMNTTQRNLNLAHLASPWKYYAVKMGFRDSDPITFTVLMKMEEGVPASEIARLLEPRVDNDPRRARKLLFACIDKIREHCEPIWNTALGVPTRRRRTAYSIQNFATRRQLRDAFEAAPSRA